MQLQLDHIVLGGMLPFIIIFYLHEVCQNTAWSQLLGMSGGHNAAGNLSGIVHSVLSDVLKCINFISGGINNV